MVISEVNIRHFRNVNIAFSPIAGGNFIIGLNGKGKSNFIDSLSIISTGRSFKKTHNSENIAWSDSEGFAKIALILELDNNTEELSTVFLNHPDRSVHNFLLNGKRIARKKFINKLRTIFFAPHTLDLVIGSPSLRRDELDQFICMVDSNQEALFSEYSKVTKNRNKVLQRISNGVGDKEELYYWTERLLELATEIVEVRSQLVEDISPIIGNLSERLFEGQLHDLSIEYSSKIKFDAIANYREALSQKIKENINKEIVLGRSLYGPHRDDLGFLLSGASIQSIGSRGQQRIASIIFKLAQWQFLYDMFEEKPILLLDDILSELDYENRKRLYDTIVGLDTQYFITLVSEKVFPVDIPKDAYRLLLN